MLNSLTFRFDDQLAREWTNYGDDKLDVNEATAWQHLSQAHKCLLEMHDLRSVAAEMEAKLKAEAATYLEMAREAQAAQLAEADLARGVPGIMQSSAPKPV